MIQLCGVTYLSIKKLDAVKYAANEMSVDCRRYSILIRRVALKHTTCGCRTLWFFQETPCWISLRQVSTYCRFICRSFRVSVKHYDSGCLPQDPAFSLESGISTDCIQNVSLQYKWSIVWRVWKQIRAGFATHLQYAPQALQTSTYLPHELRTGENL